MVDERHPAILAVRELRKIYKSHQVVANDGITFDLRRGTAFGLLGPNGAGKSTLVRQIVGLLTPDSGSIQLYGEKLEPGRRRAAATIAYMPQGSLALGELKVREAVSFTARLRGVGRIVAERQSTQLLRELSIQDLADRPIRKLSGGQRRLVQIAMTLAGDLPVLIFDEPTTDIDPSLRGKVWELISQRARAGAAVLLVTHDVAEAEHVLNEVAILHEGRITAMGAPAALKARLAHQTRIEVVLAESFSGDRDGIASDLGASAIVKGRLISCWVPADDAVRLLEKTVSAVGLDNLEDVRLVSPTLQDVYLQSRAGSEPVA